MSTITEQDIVRIGLFDDEQDLLDLVNDYVAENLKQKVNIKSTTNSVEAIRYIIDQSVDVMVVDFNLTGVDSEENGFHFLQNCINSFTTEIRYFLFTGASFRGDLYSKCKELRVTVVRKHEGIDTLMSNILNKKTPQKSIDKLEEDRRQYGDLILNLANDVVMELEIQAKDPSFTINFGEQKITPQKMILEIKRLSETGIKYIENYFHLLKVLNKKGAKKPSFKS
jgi:hypothetical protein